MHSLLSACALVAAFATSSGLENEVKKIHEIDIGDSVLDCDYDKSRKQFVFCYSSNEKGHFAKLYRTEDGKESVLEGLNSPMNRIVFSHDGKWVFGANRNGKLFALDVISRKLKKVHKYQSPVVSVKLVGQSMLAIQRAGVVPTIYSFDEKTAELKDVFSDDQKAAVFSSSNDGEVIGLGSQFWLQDPVFPGGQVWELDIKSKKIIRTYIGPHSDVNCIEFSNNKDSIICGFNNGNIVVFNRQNGTRIISFDLGDSVPNDIDIMSNNEMILCGNRDGSVCILGVRTKKQIMHNKAHRMSVCKVGFMGCNKEFFSLGYDGKLVIWKILDNQN